MALESVKTITNATNASPIVITTSAAHNLETGNMVLIAGCIGNTAPNKTWVITVVDSTHLSLDGSTGNGTYASGGTVTQVQNTPGADPDIDPVTDSATTEGTGSITLDSNQISGTTGFSTDLEYVLYNIVAVDSAGAPSGDWEIGYGQYFSESKRLRRESVIASSATSNGGNTGKEGVLVDFASGSKFVTFIEWFAEGSDNEHAILPSFPYEPGQTLS